MFHGEILEAFMGPVSNLLNLSGVPESRRDIPEVGEVAKTPHVSPGVAVESAEGRRTGP